MGTQTELKELVVRPILPQEEAEWNRLMATYHYLGFKKLVGESIKYIAEIRIPNLRIT